VSDLIQKVEETYTKTREEREEARRLKEKFENLKAEYERSLKKLKSKKSKILEEAYIEALKIVRDTEKKAREILRLAAKREDEALIKKSLGSIHQNISKKLGEFKREEETLSPASVEIGKKVFIKSLNIEGLISNFSEDGKIEVQTDTAKVNVPLSHLREIKEEKSVEKDKSWSGDLKVEKELNLLGLTVEESLERVDRYLTNAYASKVTEVKIIHGKGSGALRGGVQKFLMEHPLVEAFRMGNSHEGGMGITIVYLKDR
jgi:DNA mismatch repair protein MutS2